LGTRRSVPLAIPFSGSAKIDELTDAQLEFSVKIPVDLPAFLAAFLDVAKADILIAVKITYVAEGSRNTAEFSINGHKQKKNVHIQSKTDERVLTPPGALEIPTGISHPLVPDKVAIREVHMIPAKDHVKIKVGMAAPTPDFTISVSNKQ
jgi:hypothetical protein